MKCLSCDKILSDYEATRKYSNGTTYVDLCDSCFAPVAEEIPTINRTDLQSEHNEYDLAEDG